MNNQMTLKDCGIRITSGQIMSRVSTKNEKFSKLAPNSQDYSVAVKRVLIPKAINPDGSIDSTILPEEQLITDIDESKLTKNGLIVMKLSTPYDAGIVDEKSAGCVVPSFCALVMSSNIIDTRYLLAFLNSASCKEQLKKIVAGSVITVLSVGKISGISIPVISMPEQIAIGKRFMEIQEKRKVINEIIRLESKRNDILFKNLEG